QGPSAPPSTLRAPPPPCPAAPKAAAAMPARGPTGAAAREKPLPGLSDRIEAMGLRDEYAEFSARYLAWRTGKSAGARGEPSSARPREPGAGPPPLAIRPAVSDTSNRSLASPIGQHDFAFWYPSVGEWRWRRTISFWIGLTFFEGSVFFAVSSFLGCASSSRLNTTALTTGGYIWGKAHFLICTYLMVVSTVNMDPVGGHKKFDNNGDQQSEDSDSSSSEDETAVAIPGEMAAPRFMTNPFRYRTAVDRLNALGAGPWPYVASLIYFTGCLTFTVGLVAEYTCPREIAEVILNYAFVLGSLQFLMGGIAECIENNVFSSLEVNSAWTGSVLNFLGGCLFLLGSLVPFVPAWGSFWGSLWFGVGSTLYGVAGSIQLTQWRSEQFGLVYMAVLNKLGGPQGQSVLHTPSAPQPVTYSKGSLWMIHIFCIAGAISCYDFNLSLAHMIADPTLVNLRHAMNELLPCVILHMQIALRTAVVRTPHFAPYPFALPRILSAWLVLDAVASFVELLEQGG
ncbi:unnamed protein product, partial [Prorocentrum cordatum]